MGAWFQREIVDNDRLALFLCFWAFIATFVTTRVITRLIRSGRGPLKNNVAAGGLHIHHAVPGLILLVVGAFIAVGTGSEVPWAEIAAVLIGIGTSLVLDEFALILHLQDVYWSDEGRISVEMVSLAIACLGLALIGFSPVEFNGEAGDNVLVLTGAAGVLLHLFLVVICVVKGKYRMALFGTFIPMLAFVCSLRLARPTSLWARRFYDDEKRARAGDRAQRYDARFDPFTSWVSDFVAGRPSEPDPRPQDAADPARP